MTFSTTRKFKFTKRLIDALPAHSKAAASTDAEYTDTDVSGLKLTVSKTGRKTFLLRYTLNGAKRCMKLGEYGAIDIEAARRLALQARADVQSGIDPQQARKAQKAMPSFRDFAQNDYMPIATGRKRSYKDDQSRLNSHIYAYFGSKPINTISKKDIQDYLTDLRNKGALKPSTANRHLSLLSVIFNMAVDHGLMASNPCTGMKKYPENNARDRYLSEDELGRLYTAMNAKDPATCKYIEQNRAVVNVLKLLLLTGTRREEALSAKWSNINLQRGLWLLPHTKSGKSRHVTLNAEAIALLNSLPKHQGSDFVFVNPATGTRVNTPVKAFHRLLEMAGIENLRIHDLRHTFASIAVNSGVSLYQVQHLLGHASSQTTQRYSHLSNDVLREASNRVGNYMGGTKEASSNT
jgi:integrase